MNFEKIREKVNFYLNEFDWQSYLKRERRLMTKVLTASLFVVFFIYILFLSPPNNFPIGHVVNIEDGASLEEIINTLKRENVIRYPLVFKILAYATFSQRDLIEGDYFFNIKRNSLSVLLRLKRGEYGLSSEFITLPEGVTIKEIAFLMKEKFKDFDADGFIRLASGKEGYLFPDTYKFLPNVRPRNVIQEMENNFKNKLAPLLSEIEESGKTLEEIIIMASLLEEEARTTQTRKMISGILWNRIEIDMPLQVDAVFPYIIGKNTYELTLEDLGIDSPYNTYKYKGLPAGAISNPGLDSIEAAIYPTENDYLFYLSDRNGRIYYAKNFEGHKRNRLLYLN